MKTKTKTKVMTSFDNIKRMIKNIHKTFFSCEERLDDLRVVEKHLKQYEKEHDTLKLTIARERKVLKLIVAKNVNIEILKMSKDVKDYNWFIYPSKERILTKDEFNSLKETICESL